MYERKKNQAKIQASVYSTDKQTKIYMYYMQTAGAKETKSKL